MGVGYMIHTCKHTGGAAIYDTKLYIHDTTITCVYDR